MSSLKRPSLESRPMSPQSVADSEVEGLLTNATPTLHAQHIEKNGNSNSNTMTLIDSSSRKLPSLDTSISTPPPAADGHNNNMWGVLFCFAGIMVSFVSNNLLLEKATSSSSYQLHELSFILVTSSISVVVSYVLGRIQQQPITPLPWSSFGLVGLLNLGSMFFSILSLRYVIFPVKVLAKSCKPVTVMLGGFCLGKRCK